MLPASTARERARLLANEVEQLVVEAKKLAMSLQDVTAALAHHWHRLNSQDASRTTPAADAALAFPSRERAAKGASIKK